MLNKLLFAGLSGLLFSTGLVVSGMTQPMKVIGFLNVAGLKNGVSWNAAPKFWDPSLALVMGGALLVTLIAFATTARSEKPWFDTDFHLPTRIDLDIRLIAGAALFGIGWGLAGYCPGPAFASLLVAGQDVLVFSAALILGMIIAKKWLST